MYNSDTLTIKD